MQALGGAAASGGTAILVGAGAAAAGAIAGQLAAMALGMQQKFDWKAVAVAAVGGAVTAGIGSVDFNAGGLSNAIVRSAISNAVSQGVSIALGAQKDFSWRSIAASAVSAGVSYGLSSALGPQKINPNQDPGTSNISAPMFGDDSVGKVTRGFLTGLAAGITSTVVNGGKVRIATLAVDAFGNALSNHFKDIAEPGQEISAYIDREDQELGRAMRGNASETEQHQRSNREYEGIGEYDFKMPSTSSPYELIAKLGGVLLVPKRITSEGNRDVRDIRLGQARDESEAREREKSRDYSNRVPSFWPGESAGGQPTIDPTSVNYSPENPPTPPVDGLGQDTKALGRVMYALGVGMATVSGFGILATRLAPGLWTSKHTLTLGEWVVPAAEAVSGATLPGAGASVVFAAKAVDVVGDTIKAARGTGANTTANPASRAVVVFDGEFATKQLLGTSTTPGGRTINFHAADRMVNPPAGRLPMSPAEIDQVLDGATSIVKRNYHPEGNTLTIQNANLPGKPRVIVDEATGSRVITVINPKKR
jgi:hypothetical protein